MNFEKNIFNIALSFSLIWHFLGVQAVNIVWPGSAVRPGFAAVNFWGAILETTDLANVRLASLDLKKSSSIPKEIKNKKQIQDFNLKKSALPLAELSQKQTPELTEKPVTPERFSVFESRQDDLGRSVIYKPELPKYPEWLRKLGSDFEVNLKFLILPDGTIANVEKVSSSGYPEVDEIGVRYIRKWKFMPVARDLPQENQWGLIKLVFKLK
jgi:TonB family protein